MNKFSCGYLLFIKFTMVGLGVIQYLSILAWIGISKLLCLMVWQEEGAVSSSSHGGVDDLLQTFRRGAGSGLEVWECVGHLGSHHRWSRAGLG